MTWNEIDKRKSCGSIARSALCSKAQARLQALKIADTDTIYKLRIASKPRVWGIKQAATLKVIWWDPEHTVYPVAKGHT